MERKTNDLWQGGPWEQPSRPVLTPPCIPKPQRPVLRVKRRRRSPLLILIPVLIVSAIVLALVIGAVLYVPMKPYFQGRDLI